MAGWLQVITLVDRVKEVGVVVGFQIEPGFCLNHCLAVGSHPWKLQFVSILSWGHCQ